MNKITKIYLKWGMSRDDYLDTKSRKASIRWLLASSIATCLLFHEACELTLYGRWPCGITQVWIAPNRIPTRSTLMTSNLLCTWTSPCIIGSVRQHTRSHWPWCWLPYLFNMQISSHAIILPKMPPCKSGRSPEWYRHYWYNQYASNHNIM